MWGEKVELCRAFAHGWRILVACSPWGCKQSDSKAHLLGGQKERTGPTEGGIPGEGFRGLLEDVRVNGFLFADQAFSPRV